jgi:hypothetical protein
MNIKQPPMSEEDILKADGILQPESKASVKPVVAAKPIEELIPASTRTKTQQEIDQEMSLIRLETEKLRLEKEKLDLEKLTNDIQAIRRKNEAQKIARETVQESLDYERNTRIHNETYCTHMKGGDSGSMMHGGPAQGNDASNYALIQHTFTTGVTFRLCSRCGKTWFPKDPDYRWAMTRPTRNSPSSGSPSPGLVRNGKHVRLISEVPHQRVPDNDYNVPEYQYPNS